MWKGCEAPICCRGGGASSAGALGGGVVCKNLGYRGTRQWGCKRGPCGSKGRRQAAQVRLLRRELGPLLRAGCWCSGGSSVRTPEQVAVAQAGARSAHPSGGVTQTDGQSERGASVEGRKIMAVGPSRAESGRRAAEAGQVQPQAAVPQQRECLALAQRLHFFGALGPTGCVQWLTWIW